MNDNGEQEGQMHSRPASILRVSGSYRNNQISNHPSITITLPTDTPSGVEVSSDASDAQAQQQRRQRREQFEQLRREHYHNMVTIVNGQQVARRPSMSVQVKPASARSPSASSAKEQPAAKSCARKDPSAHKE